MNRLEKRFKKHFAHKPGLIKTGMGWGFKKTRRFFSIPDICTYTYYYFNTYSFISYLAVYNIHFFTLLISGVDRLSVPSCVGRHINFFKLRSNFDLLSSFRREHKTPATKI